MAATKNRRVIIAESTSNSAGSTTTGTVVDLTTCYGGVLTARITNGASGPTAAAQVNVYFSSDNTTFYLASSYAATTTNSAVLDVCIDIPAGVMYLRADVTGNSGQAVTCAALLHELTTI